MDNKTDIEEDIEILENIINDYKFRHSSENIADKGTYLGLVQVQAIENILADRERLIKENDIYKEENQKITKALDFREGTLNPDASIIIKSMKQALIQLKAKANKYDSLVEKIENTDTELANMKVEGEVFTTAVNFARKELQELLDTEK